MGGGEFRPLPNNAVADGLDGAVSADGVPCWGERPKERVKPEPSKAALRG